MGNKEKERIEILYNKDGESIIEEGKTLVCAKYERKPISGGKEVLDIFLCLFDPQGRVYSINESPTISMSNKRMFKMRKVSQDCFESYLEYLRTKSTKSWQNANRKAGE